MTDTTHAVRLRQQHRLGWGYKQTNENETDYLIKQRWWESTGDVGQQLSARQAKLYWQRAKCDLVATQLNRFLRLLCTISISGNAVEALCLCGAVSYFSVCVCVCLDVYKCVCQPVTCIHEQHMKSFGNEYVLWFPGECHWKTVLVFGVVFALQTNRELLPQRKA